MTTTPGFEPISPLRLYLDGIVHKSRLAILVLKALGYEDIDVLGKFCAKLSNKCLYPLRRFSYDLQMKTRKQSRNNKRTEIERFDWLIERIQTRVAFGWLSERPRTF